MSENRKPEGKVICSRCFRALGANAKGHEREVPRTKPLLGRRAAPLPGGLTAEEWKQLLADEVQAFVDARLSLAEQVLSDEERRIFDSMTYGQRAVFVFSCVREGYLR